MRFFEVFSAAGNVKDLADLIINHSPEMGEILHPAAKLRGR